MAEFKHRGKKLIQVAPMLDVTDRDFRCFARLVSSKMELWTEMVTADAIIHNLNDPERLDHLLGWNPSREGSVVLQLGGNNPETLRRAAEIARSQFGYGEVNLNAGCPSCKVAGAGEFGASLMKKPKVISDCLKAIGGDVSLKTRLGVDDFDSDDFFADVIDTSACTQLAVHARIALLNGISPAQNRSIPPLNYPRAFRVLEDRKNISWTLNGGINSIDQVQDLLRLGGENMVGVMIGRAAAANPLCLADVDRSIYGCDSNPITVQTRRHLLEAYSDYLHDTYDADLGTGSVFTALRPIMGVFTGLPGNKKWRNSVDVLSRDRSLRDEGGPSAVLSRAISETSSEILDLVV